MPLRVERSELRCDSGGEGRTRGGLGLRREIRLLDGEARYSVLSDRVVLAPDGEVDARATLAERARLAAARRRDERDPYEGRRGKHRVLRLAPRLAHALRLETGDLVEMLGRHARRSARGCAEDVAAGLRTTPGKISAVRNPPVLQAPASVDAQWRPTGRSGIFPEPTRGNP